MRNVSLAALASLLVTTPILSASDRHTTDTDVIRHLVGTYTQSIDDADTKLATTVWSTTPDVSFINPLGEEQGWNEIATASYGQLMGHTKRDLKVTGPVNIQVYGKAAVVQFHWEFTAVVRSDGQSVHTTGRESQVYASYRGQAGGLSTYITPGRRSRHGAAAFNQ